MTEQEVIEAIEYMQKYQTETDKIEAKTAEKDFPKKCYDTISAFANKSGGIIIFGINENNNFIEQDVYDVNDLQKKITSLCTTSLEPKIRPEFLPVTYNNKKLLAVKIEELPQTQKPCYYKESGVNKGSYIRIGESDEHMTDYEIYDLYSYRENIAEDLRVVERADLSEFKQDKLMNYIKSIKEKKPNLERFSDEQILALSGIIDSKTKKPTVAGTFLFAEFPQAYFPQMFVACVVVPGRRLGQVGIMGQRFDDNERVEGTIDEMVEKTLAFIRRNIGTRIIIDDDGKRTDIPHYPMKALREAIINALIHRDYSKFREGAYVYVQVYDDRIQIISPGGLYGGIKSSDLGTVKMLEARNKTIVRILEETTDLVENRHTGIETMREEMKNMKLPQPEFIVDNRDFTVIFRKENKGDIIEDHSQNNKEISVKNLTETQAKIIELIEQNRDITRKMLAKELNLSMSAIASNLKKLKDNGYIERIGSDKYGHWKTNK